MQPIVAQQVRVAQAAGQADAVEVFQDVDGQLAAGADAVAERGGRYRAIGRFPGKVADDIGQGGDGRPVEIMIVGDAVDPSHARRLHHQLAHRRFVQGFGAGDIAHPRRLKRVFQEQGRDPPP